MNIGIFGGSFNPIHNGHLHIARAALQQTDVEEVWILVSPQNPLKANTAQPLAIRYQLARIALHGEPHIKASHFETALTPPYYTWNTLQALQSTYPQHHFSLIIGEDNWDSFEKWHRHEDIISHYTIIVYPRSAASAAAAHTTTAENTATRRHPIFLTGQFMHISSTDVRQRLHNHEDTKNLVPDIIQPILPLFYD